MKVTREQAAENRERVLETAARQFRERGFDGVGVAELMQDAGLTHGAFYGQFASKDELAVESVVRAFERSLAAMKSVADRAGGQRLRALLKAYLSPAHRDNPGLGCVVAALGPEASRKGPALRHAVTEGVKAQITMLGDWMSGRTAAARRESSIAAYATMVGALVLARAVDDAALSAEILRTVRSFIEGSDAPS